MVNALNIEGTIVHSVWSSISSAVRVRNADGADRAEPLVKQGAQSRTPQAPDKGAPRVPPFKGLLSTASWQGPHG